MSFPNPDNYARDCDCGTAGANATPPPVAIQAEIDSLDTRVTALEDTNDVIVSSGGIADLTTAQQALIREGSIVVTTDGKRWVYSGAGSKVLEASYIQLSDVTIVSTDITDSTTAGRALLTAATVQSQRTALDIFVSAANLAAFPASGNLQRVYLALDTAKTYVWNGASYVEISPFPPVELVVACSDEISNLTVGNSKATFRSPCAFTLTSVRASVNTAPTGSILIVDINENGTSVLSTKLSIDENEKTSTTAATPAVISDSSIAADAEITIDIDQVGSTIAGKGLKVTLIGTRL